tara:strand:- start:159 stop:608 length:450 start_codon:yes stop_codon:yes gene_type:complete
MTLRATAPCPIGCGNRVDLDEILCGTIGGCLNIEGLPDGDNRLLAGAGAIDCDDDDGDSLPDDDGDGSCGNRLLASGGAIDCDDGVDFDKVTCGIIGGLPGGGGGFDDLEEACFSVLAELFSSCVEKARSSVLAELFSACVDLELFIII